MVECMLVSLVGIVSLWVGTTSGHTLPFFLGGASFLWLLWCLLAREFMHIVLQYRANIEAVVSTMLSSNSSSSVVCGGV